MGSSRTLHSRLAKEGLVVIGGQAATAGVSLAAIRLITEVLSSDSYGRIVLVLIVLSLLQSLLVSPLLAAHLRFHPEARDQGRGSVLTRALASNVIQGGTAVFVVASVVAGALAFTTRKATPVIVLAASILWVVAIGLCGYVKNIMNAERFQMGLAATSIAEAGLKPGVAVLLVVSLGVSTGAFVGGQAIGVMIATLAAAIWLYLRSNQGGGRTQAMDMRIAGANSVGMLAHEIRLYALPLIPLALVNWVTHLSDRYILAYFHGSSDVGIYAAAYGLVSQPFLLLGSTATLIFRPYLYEAAGRGEHDAMVRHCFRWLAFTVALGVFGWATVFLFAQPIADLLLAEQYRVGVAIFPVIAAAYLIVAIGFVFENWILAIKRTRALLWRAVASMAVSLVLAVALIPRYSLIGAAWATVCGFASHTVMCFVVFRRSMGN